MLVTDQGKITWEKVVLNRLAPAPVPCVAAGWGLAHLEGLAARAGTQHPTPDGTCVRDYVHVTDLVAAHVLGLQHLSNPPGLFNVATGRGVSVREFVDACRAATGADIRVQEQPEARPGDNPEVCAVAARPNPRPVFCVCMYLHTTEARQATGCRNPFAGQVTGCRDPFENPLTHSWH